MQTVIHSVTLYASINTPKSKMKRKMKENDFLCEETECLAKSRKMAKIFYLILSPASTLSLERKRIIFHSVPQ